MSRVADALRRANLPTPDADAFTTVAHPWGRDLEIGDISESQWRGTTSGSRYEDATDHAATTVEPQGAGVDQERSPAGISPIDDLPPSIRQQLAGIVDRVFLPTGGEPPRTVAFAGVEVDARSGWIAAAVADMLAQRTLASVCLADMNFGDPRVHECFGIGLTPGLSDALSCDMTLAAVARPVRVNLAVIPSGEPAFTSQISLGSRAQIARLASAHDYVILSLEPLAASMSGTIPVGVDGIVLVVAADSTRRHAGRMVAERLQRSGTRILGAVLTNRRHAIPEAIYRRL